MLQEAINALGVFIEPVRFGVMIIGILLGITVGVLPGLSGLIGMSLLLPFVYGMDPHTGMALLIGMVAVTHTSDTFPSVLIGVPGTSGAQATIMDGFPLARRGEASRALGAAFFASLVGGVIGGIALFIAIPVARPLILAFGSPELFMLSLLGLSIVGVVSSESPFKGIIAGVLGLLAGSIGTAPTVTEYRFTFDSLYLSEGFPLPVLALSLFAFPILLDLLIEDESISKVDNLKGSWLTGIKDALKNKFLIFKNAVIGVLMGFIPGVGGSVIDWIAYGFTKQTEKNTENFGKGDIRGVIAPESANNAKEGGTLIPTLMFGIPGSGTTAILLGGLTLMGLQAGPSMITQNLSVTLTIVWTLVIANVIGAALCIALIRPISRISTMQSTTLVPFLIVLLTIGAYQSTRHWGDLILFIVLGLFSWILKTLDWPRAPILIGFVLSVPAERYLWLSMSRFGLDWMLNPGVIIIGVIIIALVVGNTWIMRSKGGNAIE